MSRIQNHRCPYCQTVLLGSESSSLCCSMGSAVLHARDTDVPPAFRAFFAKWGSLLLSNSREVNGLCALCVIGVKGANGQRTGGVAIPYDEHCVELRGRIYHCTTESGMVAQNPLIGNGSTYLIDEALNESAVTGVSTEILHCALEFRELLKQRNSVIQVYRAKFADSLRRGGIQSLQSEYHADSVPQTTQPLLVALYQLFGSVFRRPETVGRILTETNARLKMFSSCEADYERSSFPLLDPEGLSGWFEIYDGDSRTRTRFESTSGRELTLHQYLRAKLLQSKILPLIPRLAEEWILDCTSKLEEIAQQQLVRVFRNRGNIVVSNVDHRHETGRRVARERELSREEGTGEFTGRLMRIPESVRGSWNSRKSLVSKGMAQAYALGFPSLFITFTGNPKWDEISKNIPAGSHWTQQPALVCRVFHQKLLEFISMLPSSFGAEVTYCQYAIEFQKRGMPHCHMLCRLAIDTITPCIANRLTCCRLPDVCQCTLPADCAQCTLRHNVLDFMIHKCVPNRCYKVTEAQRTCKYGFPKPPVAFTHVGEDGFWKMQRTSTEAQVVCYNPLLSLHFNAHINVEVASSAHSIFYLRKYMSKSPDTVNVRARRAGSLNEELNVFYETRCLTSFEAVWAALEFPFNYFEPSVLPIKLYGPGARPVVFTVGEITDALDRAAFNETDIERYMKRPVLPQFDKILLERYFSEYSITKNKRTSNGFLDQCFTPNKVLKRTRPVVAFVENVQYSDEEAFSLYLLIKQVAFRSWPELLWGEQTFYAAAKKRGLFVNDGDVHESVIRDFIAKGWPSIRIVKYIATLLTVESSCATDLIRKFARNMVPPRFFQLIRNDEDACKIALQELQAFLFPEGIDLAEVLQNEELHSLLLHPITPGLNTEQTAFQRIRTLAMNQEDIRLNTEQTMAKQQIVASNENLFYVNGAAGCGKTTLLKSLIKSFVEMGKCVVCAAYTGCAAGLLPGGITGHRLFGLPADDQCDSNAVSSVTPKTLNGKMLMHADVIVFDELSMLHVKYFSCIDKCLRDLMKSDVPFGGKKMLFAGDARQLAPVITGCSSDTLRVRTVASSVYSAHILNVFHVLNLTKGERFESDVFSKKLLDIGSGSISSSFDQNGAQSVTLDSSFRVTYALDEGLNMLSNNQERALMMMAPHHHETRMFNERIIQAHRTNGTEEVRTFLSYQCTPKAPGFCLEQIEDINKGGIAQHRLSLFVGMPVMLLRNIFPSRGLFNGAILKVKHMETNCIGCELQSNREEIIIPRIQFSFSVDAVEVLRSQFPLVPAYGVTVGKLQGQTLSGVVLDLRRGVFQHGQLYVALSRVRSINNIVILLDPEQGRTITNVVYKELLAVLR